MNRINPSSRSTLQLIWGIALLLAGVGVFIRVPQVIPRLAQLQVFAGATGIVRFCFYLIGVILMGGGLQKIVRYFRSPPSAPSSPQGPDDPHDS
jgi:hypothetical protein